MQGGVAHVKIVSVKTLTINNLEELDAAAQALSLLLEPGMTVLLNGELGSGKSEFTRHVLKHLGVTEEITSPTFCFVNSYKAGPAACGRLSARDESIARDQTTASASPASYDSEQSEEFKSFHFNHFDVYRLEDESELDEIGFDELGYNPRDGVAFIEWSDKFVSCMPEDALHIDFFGHGDNPRKLEIYGNDLADRWVECIN